MTSMMFTYQTRIVLSQEDEVLLKEMAKFLSRVERCMFADYCKGHALSSLKSGYLKEHGITARQFNAIRMQLEGKIASIKEKEKEQIASDQESIRKTRKTIQRLEHRLAQKQKDQEQGKVRLCFGSKKLFHAQFHLEESGYRSHEEWKRAFQEKRDSGFILVGSKDESMGNQSCQAMLGDNNAITLHIRLPNPLVQGNKKHITVSCVPFSYGQE
ncbi:MAG: transposase, partial [Chlamydiae bacterium]|nr:transposase [Chlamydiota bacterium]